MAGSGWRSSSPTAAATVLASVRQIEAGQASGATNAIREVGGVMGVAVLAAVFAANGGYAPPAAFTDGVQAALPIGVAVLAVGAVVALLVPGRRRMAHSEGSSSTASARRSRTTLPARAPRGRGGSRDPPDRGRRGRGRSASRTCGRSGSAGISSPAPASVRSSSARPSRRETNRSATGTPTPATRRLRETIEAGLGAAHRPLNPGDAAAALSVAADDRFPPRPPGCKPAFTGGS